MLGGCLLIFVGGWQTPCWKLPFFKLGVRGLSVLVGKHYVGGCQKPVTVGNKSIRICEGNLIIDLHYPAEGGVKAKDQKIHSYCL